MVTKPRPDPILRFFGGTASGVSPITLTKYKQIIRLYEDGVPISKLRRQVGVRNKTVSDALKAYRELKSGDVTEIGPQHITQTETVFGREYYYAGNAVVAVVNGGVTGPRFDLRVTFEDSQVLPMGVVMFRLRDIVTKAFHPKPVLTVAEAEEFLEESEEESDGDIPDYYVILYSLQLESVTRSASRE